MPSIAVSEDDSPAPRSKRSVAARRKKLMVRIKYAALSDNFQGPSLVIVSMLTHIKPYAITRLTAHFNCGLICQFANTEYVYA